MQKRVDSDNVNFVRNIRPYMDFQVLLGIDIFSEIMSSTESD